MNGMFKISKYKKQKINRCPPGRTIQIIPLYLLFYPLFYLL
jgi:hypothetical protein